MLNQKCAGFLFQVASQVDVKEHAREHGIKRIQREKTNKSLNQASSDADGDIDIQCGAKFTRSELHSNQNQQNCFEKLKSYNGCWICPCCNMEYLAL